MPSNAELAAKLLRDASTFFETIGEQNPQLVEQMTQNATVFREVAERVEQDPTGEVEPEPEPQPESGN